jgi:hypothetical protein
MNFSLRDRWLFVARAMISLIVLIPSLWVILSGTFPEATTKWAIGIIGLIVGYWLR